MQGGLLHRSHSILMVLTPFYANLSLKILIFQELLMVETQNKCLFGMSQILNCTTLKPFQCIFPSQNLKFLPEILIFQEPLIVETQKMSHWIHGMPQTLNACHSSHFDAFFPVKINKMWNFCLKFWFFQEPLIIVTWNLCHWIWYTLNPKYVPLKPFQCIFPTQNQQNVKFLAVYWTPPDKKWKKMSIWTWKKCLKRLEILHI